MHAPISFSYAKFIYELSDGIRHYVHENHIPVESELLMWRICTNPDRVRDAVWAACKALYGPQVTILTLPVPDQDGQDYVYTGLLRGDEMRILFIRAHTAQGMRVIPPNADCLIQLGGEWVWGETIVLPSV